jgi:chaperone BCS1
MKTTGVATNEGHVLIMTTNCPEKLDPALVRPGRIDLQVEFTNATNFHAKEIFESMYATEPINITNPTPTQVAVIKTSVEKRLHLRKR